MAKKDFTRSIVTSTIMAASVSVEAGQVVTKELPPITKVGTAKLSDDKALKLAKATYKNAISVVVLAVETAEETRGMDLETFLKYSEPVERPASQQKKDI